MPAASQGPSDSPPPAWSLLSAHGRVLFSLAMEPESTLRDVAQQLGLTERTIYGVIRDLSDANMVRVRKVGRRNSYAVNPDAYFLHAPFAHLRLGSFLDALRAG